MDDSKKKFRDSKKKFRDLVEYIYPDQFSVFLKRLKDKEEGETISTIVKEVFEQYPLVQGMLFELSGEKENEEKYYKGWRLLMMEQYEKYYKNEYYFIKKISKPVEFAESNQDNLRGIEIKINEELKYLEKANSGNTV